MALSTEENPREPVATAVRLVAVSFQVKPVRPENEADPWQPQRPLRVDISSWAGERLTLPV